MNSKTLVEKMLAGSPMIVGIVHTHKLEPLNMRDKTTGKVRQAHLEKLNLLTETGIIVVTNWCPDDLDVATWKPAFKRGDRVAVEATKLENRGGIPSLSGVPELIKD